MTFPVEIAQSNGLFSASVVGKATVRAEASTRDLAIAAIRDEIRNAVTRGEIAMVEVDVRPDSCPTCEADYGETPEDFIREVNRLRDLQKDIDLAEMDRAARI